MKIEIEQVTSDRQKRIDAHSHIKKLGLDGDGRPRAEDGGFIGQEAAREAAGIVVELIKQKRLAGRSVLLAGPSSTGKTAISLGIARELGDSVPFAHLVASEVFSAEVKKTEVLMEHFRRAIGLRIKEVKEVFEGEVASINAIEAPSNGPGAPKTISHVNITLRTRKSSRELKLDGVIYQQLEAQKIRVGDIIYIEANSGLVKRLGRSDKLASETQLESDSYVPMPKGEVHRKREIVQDITLHDLDIANANPRGGQDLVSIMNQFNKIRKTEITDKLRQEIDKVVSRYLNQGICELQSGLLFIDEAHLLDLECFSFLNKAMESPLAPVIIFATNRGICEIRGSGGVKSPHGLPRDLLDRLLVIKTLPYQREDIAKILKLRASVEEIPLTNAALEKLAELGHSSSLRYAMQLLFPAFIVAKIEAAGGLTVIDSSGSVEVDLRHVEEVSELFMDARRAVEKIQSDAAGYLK
ncbi:Putative TIP49 C-terminus protein [Giardia duodenalis]|uniref:RuvB-like helicase n=2 Tax=Giardia intestinalis TaxID=5741 RepID=C6LQ13_GIAIB|nr:TBP-interacting protein TIP49 [Giardia intestinalis ATCC 50581]ESU45099.1 Putative TIP49 C-terminus protein [Giardia intestinalis]